MKPFIIINPENPGSYYSLFYLLAVVVCFIFLLIEGKKKKFPMIPWMMVIATAFLFFMIGCKVITFSKEEWNYVFHLEQIPYFTTRSVLGGILLSIPGIFLAKKCLRFHSDMIDTFAQALPLAFVIQRFGCLMTGCCYGALSDLPWAIVYGDNSHAFFQHVHDGLLSANSTTALPVHPVQMYEILCCMVIIFLLTKIRKIVKAPGNLFLSSIGLYGAFRFLLEFLRASRGNSDNELFLNYIQWIILLILPILFFSIRSRERKVNVKTATPNTVSNNRLGSLSYFLLLILIFQFTSPWLGMQEIISFNLVLLPMLTLLVWYVLVWTTATPHRLAIFSLPLLAFLLMSQTLPEYSNDKNKRISYNTFSLGWMGGSSELLNHATYGSQGCNGPVYTTISSQYDNKYSALASGIARTIQLEENGNLTFGINGFIGSHHEVFEYKQTTSSYSDIQTGDRKFFYTGIKPYAQFDQENYGWGAGFHFGRLANINYPNYHDDGSTYYRGRPSVSGRSSVLPHRFYPSISLRLGSLNKIFVEYRLANQFPTNFPILNNQFALGVGFFRKNTGNIRLGTASHISFFIAPTIPIGKHIIAEAYVGGGKGLAHQDGQVKKLTSSIGLHYKFNKKEK